MPTDLLTNSDDGGYSTDPLRPDYASPAYRAMAHRWMQVDDIREGTGRLRDKKEIYLPKFEAEDRKDWDARVAMTFVTDHYAATLDEHVGMVTAEPIKLAADVPRQFVDLVEDIDGEGNHLDVFASGVLDAAMHLGHSVIFTDYPVTDAVKTRGDQRRAQVRPYATLYAARDVFDWDHEAVGGVKVLTMIKFRERLGEDVQYKTIRQAVFYDDFTGRATSLGAITWETWKPATVNGKEEFVWVGSGVIGGTDGSAKGPKRIPARVVYGGRKVGALRTVPHLHGLALLNIEETQVQSDYANVMHKCNVPTPVFKGRVGAVGNDGSAQPINLSKAIDVAADGDGKYMEPAGTALAATRNRLLDLTAKMRRHGASTAQGEGGQAISATEAAQNAKARNARVRVAARSLQDALEGMLADMAAFMGIEEGLSVSSGGSISVNQDFAGPSLLDPQVMVAYVQAAKDIGFPLNQLLREFQRGGRVADDVDLDALELEMEAARAAAEDQAAMDAKAQSARLAA